MQAVEVGVNGNPERDHHPSPYLVPELLQEAGFASTLVVLQSCLVYAGSGGQGGSGDPE